MLHECRKLEKELESKQNSCDESMSRKRTSIAKKYLSLFRSELAKFNMGRHIVTVSSDMGISYIRIDGKMLKDVDIFKKCREAHRAFPILESLHMIDAVVQENEETLRSIHGATLTNYGV